MSRKRGWQKMAKNKSVMGKQKVLVLSFQADTAAKVTAAISAKPAEEAHAIMEPSPRIMSL